jgi:hypothetical protein
MPRTIFKNSLKTPLLLVMNIGSFNIIEGKKKSVIDNLIINSTQQKEIIENKVKINKIVR